MRNTHDNTLDHHGLIAESSIGGTPTAGYAALATGTGTLAFGAVSGGGGGPVDLVTGNSATFESGIGSWTNSGGTMTFSTTAGTMFGGGSGSAWGSLKFATSASGQYVDLPISGTFSTGHTYTAQVAVMVEENTAFDFTLSLGLQGTDAASVALASTNPGSLANDGRYAVLAVNWAPSADRTGVSLRLSRDYASGTLTYHVGRVQASDLSPRASVMSTVLNMGQANVSQVPQSGYGLTIKTVNGSATISAGDHGGIVLTGDGNVQVNTPTGLTGVYVQDGYWGGCGVYTDGDWTVQAGADYVTLTYHEKDASTGQLLAAGYSTEMVDDSTSSVWRHVTSAGDASVPSYGRPRVLASAPSSPTEGDEYYDSTLHKRRCWDGSAWQNYW